MSLSVSYRSRRGEVWSAYRRKWLGGLWRSHLILGGAAASLAVALGDVPSTSAGWLKVAVIALALPALFALYPQLRFKPQERVLALDADGVATTIGKRGGTVRWSEVREVRDEGAVTIEGTNGNALVVPERAFISSEQRRAFVKFATSAIARQES